MVTTTILISTTTNTTRRPTTSLTVSSTEVETVDVVTGLLSVESDVVISIG